MESKFKVWDIIIVKPFKEWPACDQGTWPERKNFSGTIWSVIGVIIFLDYDLVNVHSQDWLRSFKWSWLNLINNIDASIFRFLKQKDAAKMNGS